MNGWQRLYVVAMVPLALLLLVGAVLNFPYESKVHYAFECPFEDYSFTQAQAVEIVATDGKNEPLASYRRGKSWPECMKRMKEISSGRALANDRERFWSDVFVGSAAFAVFAALVYSAGWAVGWVWRGFFPRK